MVDQPDCKILREALTALFARPHRARARQPSCAAAVTASPKPYMITSEIYRGADAVYDAEAVYGAERVYGIELSTRCSMLRWRPGRPSV